MKRFWESRLVITSKLIIGAVFLCAAVAILSAFLSIPGHLSGSWGRLVEAGAIASSFILFFTCVIVFFRPRSGYALGFIAGLIAVPWLVRTELGMNSWIVLNFADYGDLGGNQIVTFAKLKIVAALMVIIAIASSWLRLLPARLSFRGVPLSQRTWPAIAVGFFVLAVWFVRSAIPYRVPILGHGTGPEFCILHVKKRGLRFAETEVSVERNGRAWIRRCDRRLFQYRFVARISSVSLAETSMTTLEHVRAFEQRQEQQAPHAPPERAPRSWNGEGWYVVLKNSRSTFTTEDRTDPPQELTKLFRELEGLPAKGERLMAIQDVCLGFCYDPVAALRSH
jgi:hypothetical protein